MSDYHIDFSLSPYLLLLIVPALLLIWGVFFIGKKKRRSRITANRIVSSILQSVVAVLFIFAIAGIYVAYDEVNPQNELVILVDQSYTTKQTQDGIDEFLHELFEANEERCRMAIVSFGYDQHLALPMGKYSADDALEQYHSYIEKSPTDDTATDIAAALRFVWDINNPKGGVIKYPETAKILILSDGLQTDQDALSEVKNLALDGISVDTAFYPTARAEDDMSIIGVEFPDHNLMEREEFNLKIDIRSTYAGKAVLHFTDKDEDGNLTGNTGESVAIKRGSQTVSLAYSFDKPGVHELCFTLQAFGDNVVENNIWYSYYDVEGYHWMLILETYKGESESFATVIREQTTDSVLNIETKQIDAAVNTMTLDDLAKYNEVILYNISQSDLPEEFQQYLYDYVNVLGGGMFTVGGFEKNAAGEVITQSKPSDPTQTVPVSHAYSEDDPTDSIYSSMLPVTVEPYTPGVGVVFLCDVSSSMIASYLWRIAQETVNSLDLLTVRDYVGVVTFEDSYKVTEQMIPMTKQKEIESKLKDIENANGNGTYYAPGLRQAVTMLSTLPASVTKRHIVLMTDAGPGDPYSDYSAIMKEAHEKQGVTITIMQYYWRYQDGEYLNLGTTEKTEEMIDLAKVGGGSVCYIQQNNSFMPNTKLSQEELQPFHDALENDLKLDELKEVEIADFHPKMEGDSPILEGLTSTALNELILKGYFPTRAKLHGDVQTPLLAESAPLYAEWQLGKGRVGSIMIDLEGYWSHDLLTTEIGNKVIGNIVSHLFQKVEETKHTIELSIVEDNYRTQVNVYGFDMDEEPDLKLVAFVIPPSDSNMEIERFDLSVLSTTRNRFIFNNPSSGTYIITVLKVPLNFNIFSANISDIDSLPADSVIETLTAYRTFSYSKEYDQTMDAYAEGKELMLALSTREIAEDAPPESKFVFDAEAVFESYGIVHIVEDPRQDLLISALVIYLVGIAVRRFKFKNVFSNKRDVAGA